MFFNLYSVTESDLTSRIIIDGNSNEFTDDEIILVDSLGNLLELPNDSFWGEFNDVKQIKVTWDETNLYIAVDACSWNNNVMLFIDIYDDYGIQDLKELNTWKRSFKFYNFNPDFFLATWDTNDYPQFWKVNKGSSKLAKEMTVEKYATFNTGNLDRSMEVAIPLDSLYYDESHSLLNNPEIKFLAVLTSGDDNKSGPDAAPDNLGGMSENPDDTIVLDNYVSILIDAPENEVDEFGDGLPDLGIKPNTRTNYLKRPPFKALPLEIIKVNFDNGKVLAINKMDKISFDLKLNRASIFGVEIYNLEGKHIGNADYSNIQDEEGIQKWEWTGRDKQGQFVPFGLYVLRFIAESGEVHHKEAIAVIK